MITDVAEAPVRLRPFREEDLEVFVRSATEPEFSLPFEWPGYRSVPGLRVRWEEDWFLEKDPHYLAVAEGDGPAIGLVMWQDPRFGGRAGANWEVGILLAPEVRGRGIGTEAQRLLVEHLFATTPIHRLSAWTEVDNLVEQRSLEKCGFQREGILRKGGYRGGAWRDVCLYGRLRDDLR
jgi:RimJ/RimL family protein N-acetyltransferase